MKTEWTRALFDAFGPGGLLAREAPEFGREHLLWALTQLRHTNGRTGLMFTGDTTIADELGYNTNDHPGRRCRDVLTRFGFFTQQGKQGRAAKLRLSVPLALLDDEDAYPALANFLDDEVITVADTMPSKPRKKAAPKNGASRPADPPRREVSRSARFTPEVTALIPPIRSARHHPGVRWSVGLPLVCSAPFPR
ncbi:hypothetical protein [Streptomyces sp. NPDC059631]|uniref:hypothetical protein n=1 Tax=unclassified Streptomyces TaxID=2593676 RepID=UPI0036BFE189